MSLRIHCAMCRGELDRLGALLFSPPKDDACLKIHICSDCFERVLLMLDQQTIAQSIAADQAADLADIRQAGKEGMEDIREHGPALIASMIEPLTDCLICKRPLSEHTVVTTCPSEQAREFSWPDEWAKRGQLRIPSDQVLTRVCDVCQTVHSGPLCPTADVKCEHGIPRRFCTALHKDVNEAWWECECGIQNRIVKSCGHCGRPDPRFGSRE